MPMQRRILVPLSLASLLLASPLAVAQGVPNLGNSVQNAIERQVERQVEQAQNSAAERATNQAQNAALDRVAEQAQNSAVERTVERAAAAASEVAQQRAASAQADVIGNQTLERVQSQVETQVERAQAQAADQAQAQLERVQAQVEGAQNRIERVQSQVADSAQNQVEKIQAQVGRLPEQAAERAQQRVPVAGQVDRDVAQNALDAAADAASAADQDPGLPDAAAGTGAPGATGDAPAPGIVGTENPQVSAVDADPRAFVEITLAPGERAIESEWIMVVTPEERARLDTEAAELLRYLTGTEPFALADGELLTFRVPPDLDANDAILQLVPESMREQIDRNHVYDTQGEPEGAGVEPSEEAVVEPATAGKPIAPSKPAKAKSSLPLPMPAVCEEPVTVGMIDSGIDAAHPAFAASRAHIHQRSFVDTAIAQPPAHGTAVAGLLVGRDDSGQSGAVLRPLLPRATLYSAAVFHEQESAQGATVMRVLSALDWLLQQPDVKVINMSLAGPPNRLLARALTAAAARGRVIVAAVGNDGPYGPVRYPAAYAEAIGVTAVGRDAEVFRFANQGTHVDYAALGVDVPTARGDGGFGTETGTSLAAPIVAAFIACALEQDEDSVSALAAMDQRVRDLGAAGPDSIYGRGLLHP
ncbi:MAG TPA: S8 family serine peptidase [Pseudomonadales bacterium]